MINETKMINKMKMINKIFFLAVSLLLVFSLLACNTTKKKQLGSGTTVIETDEGWIDNNTYKMQVYGQWDRSRYYIEDKEEELGKTAKPFYGLREDAKTAAKIRAMRNFKEKMLAYIVSESKVENSQLISDLIESSLQGIIIAPQSVKETYSKSHDAIILFHFQAKGLKRIIDAAVQETLKKTNKES